MIWGINYWGGLIFFSIENKCGEWVSFVDYIKGFLKIENSWYDGILNWWENGDLLILGNCYDMKNLLITGFVRVLEE